MDRAGGPEDRKTRGDVGTTMVLSPVPGGRDSRGVCGAREKTAKIVPAKIAVAEPFCCSRKAERESGSVERCNVTWGDGSFVVLLKSVKMLATCPVHGPKLFVQWS